MKPKSNKGPSGYNPEAILRAFLIQQIEKVNDFLAERDLTKPNYWTMDSGYDTTDIYEHILFEQDSQAIIPINKRNAKQPPAGFYDFKGTPVCSGGHKMYYWGHYKGVNKFRCQMYVVKLIVFTELSVVLTATTVR